MEQKKRKISVRKVLQATVTLIVTAGCIMAVLSASEAHHKRTVSELKVRIGNEHACGFLTAAQVREMLLENRHIVPEETPVAALDLNSMEAIIRSNPWVSEAEVYVDNANALHVVINQRVPAFRVFEQEGNSYYLDSTGNTLPLSDKYTHYTIVITNVPELKNDSTGNSLKAQMFKVSQTIGADSFWNPQVASIKLNDDLTFELIPVLGNHRILLGDTAHLQEKLSNIFAFYKQVFNRIGWDKYQVINARFRGQIIASPSLPWQPPRDRAMSNMNWVKSIIGNTPPDKSAAAITITTQATPKPAAAVTALPQQSTQPATSSTPAEKKAPINKPETKEAPAQKIKTTEEKKTVPQKEKQEIKKEKSEAPKYIYEGN